MGHTKEEFLEVYYQNIGDHHDEVIEASVVATTLVSFMEDKEDWEGSPTELHGALEDIAATQKISIKAKTWPKAPNVLTRRLNELETNLLEVGIEYVCRKGGKGRKIISLRKTATTATPNNFPSESHEGGDDSAGEVGQNIQTPLFPLAEATISKGGDNDGINYDPSMPF